MTRMICLFVASALLPLSWAAEIHQDGSRCAERPPSLKSAGEALAFARATLAFVERAAPRPELAADL